MNGHKNRQTEITAIYIEDDRKYLSIISVCKVETKLKSKVKLRGIR